MVRGPVYCAMGNQNLSHNAGIRIVEWDHLSIVVEQAAECRRTGVSGDEDPDEGVRRRWVFEWSKQC